MSYGIPYMGSKSGVIELIRYIVNRHPEKKYFVDMFTGGGSVSHYVLLHTKMRVIMNDKNKYVIALYRELLFNNAAEFNKIHYNFITREEFIDVRDNPQKYPNWYVGYVLTIWSFGNRQLAYLYGRHIEPYKHALHNAIVFNDFGKYNVLPPLKTINIPQEIRVIDYKTSINKRVDFLRIIKENVDGLEYRQQHLERLMELDQLKLSENLTRLERLMELDYLELYETLPKEIKENAIFYCDPPYEDTATYQENNFNHDEFWEWFRNCPYPVYASSYAAPDDIESVNFEEKVQTLSHLGRKIKQEHIFWNGKGKIEPTLFDLLFNAD